MKIYHFLLPFCLLWSEAAAFHSRDLPVTGRALLCFFANQLRALVGTVDGDNEPQPLLVINAGNGRTGTASFVQAMNRLGLKCYHMKEGVFETPGHMKLWNKFLLESSIDFDDVMDAVAYAGFNATADAPINLFYREQMRRFPNAPVILSIRPEDENAGDAWQRSLRESVFRFPSIMASIPFRWMPGLKGFRDFTNKLHNMMAGDSNGTSEVIETPKLIKFYYHWIEDVKQNVPTEKLLIFNATEGWEPLCNHIAHVSPVVDANCREVLESGEPYPHVNDRSSVQRTQLAMRCVTILTYLILLGLCMVSGLVAVRLSGRIGKDKFD